jgi:hypothetical protein
MIDEVSGSQQLRDRVKAEALTARSMHYFNLVNLYGKPYNADKNHYAVPLKLTSGVVNERIDRDRVETIYNQIVKDLKAAIEIFKKHEVTRGDFRINLPTACILLSRVCLFMEDWEGCIAAATDAIRYSNAGITDITQATAPVPIPVYSFGETEWVFGRPEYSNFLSSSLWFVPTYDLLESYDTANDARLTAFFQTFTASGLSHRTIFKQSTVSGSFGQAIRISEAYLNRAEAYVREGENGKAANDINALREKRIRNYTPVASVTLEEVLRERHKELCFEIPRWFDLRRLGMPSVTHEWKTSAGEMQTFVLNQGDPMYTLPIPGIAVTNNPALEPNNESAYMGPRLPR